MKPQRDFMQHKKLEKYKKLKEIIVQISEDNLFELANWSEFDDFWNTETTDYGNEVIFTTWKDKLEYVREIVQDLYKVVEEARELFKGEPEDI